MRVLFYTTALLPENFRVCDIIGCGSQDNLSGN